MATKQRWHGDAESKAPEAATDLGDFGLLHDDEGYKVVLEGCARIFRFRADSIASQPGSLFLTNYRLRFVPVSCRCTTVEQLGPPRWHSGECSLKGPVTPWGSFIHTWPPSAALLDDILQPSPSASSSSLQSQDGSLFLDSRTPDPTTRGFSVSPSKDLNERFIYDIPLFSIRKASLSGRELRLICRDGRFVELELSSEHEGEGLMRVLSGVAFPSNEVTSAFAFQTRYRAGLGWDLYDYDLDMARTLVSRAKTAFERRASPCETYPPFIYMPSAATDADISGSAGFRSMGRIPVPVWAHPRNGSVLVRSAQPLVGVLGNRNAADERLVRLLCGKTYLLLDARSRAAALGNRAMGKGTESIERGYEGATELIYCDLGNIHHLKSTANNLIRVFTEGPTSTATGWSGLVDASCSFSIHNSPDAGAWLTNVSQLLRSSMRIVEAMDLNGVSACWTHCSDGWDRTAQMCALAQLLMEPDYRTRVGFATVVEKNFAAFGFKFRERARGLPKASATASTHLANRSTSPSTALGISIPTLGENVCENDEDEASPVLLLFLDCVFQLLSQFPDRFEFNESFLVAIADAYYSGRFGTFLCNTEKERLEKKITLETRSVWDWICFDERFRNNLRFVPFDGVLYANSSLRAMRLFEAYWARFDPYRSTNPMRMCFF